MTTPTTETMRGGEVPVFPGCHRFPRFFSGARLPFGRLRIRVWGARFRNPRLVALSGMTASLLLLSGCLGNSPPPVSAIPTTAAACEALRPAFPITYSSKSDTPETVKQVRAANARFLASCP